MTDANAYNDYDFEDHFDDETFPEGPPDFLADFGPILLETCTEPETKTFASGLQDFARYLRALRLNAGWSRAAVAAKAGCSEAHIVALENGQGPQSLLDDSVLRRLAGVFDVDVDEFYLLLEIEPLVESARPTPGL